MRIKRKTWLVLGISLPLLCFAVLVGGLIYFQTPAGSQRLLSWAQVTLARDFNTRLEFAEGRIHLLSGLSFKSLRVEHKTESLDAVILIPALDLSYSLSVFKKRIDIRRFVITNPTFTIRSRASEAEEEPSEESSGFESLDRLIQDPPVRFTLEGFQVDGLNIDFEQLSETGSQNLKLQGLDLRLALQTEPNRLTTQGNLRLEQPLRLSRKEQSKEQTAETSMDMDLGLTASGQWDLAVLREGHEWRYELKPSEFQIEMKDFKLAQSSGPERMMVDLPGLRAQLSPQFLARSQKLLQLNEKSIETLETPIRIQVQKMTVEQEQNKVLRRTTVEAQDLSVQSQLGDDIRSELSYKAERLWISDLSVKPADFTFQTTAQISRDLKTIQVNGASSLGGLEWLTLEGQIAREEGIGGKGTLVFAATPAMAGLLKPAASLKQLGSLRADIGFDGRSETNGDAGLRLTVAVPKLLIPSLQKPVALDWKGEGTWKQAESRVDLQGLLSFASPEWGTWHIQPQMNVQLSRQSNATLNVPSNGETPDGGEANGALIGSGRTEIKSLARAKSSVLPAAFDQPFVLSHRIEMGFGKDEFSLEGDIPAAFIENLGHMKDTKFKLTARSPDLAKGQDIDFEADLSQKSFALDKSVGAPVASIAGLSGRVQATLTGGRAFALETFSINLERPHLRLTAQATGDVQSQNILARTELALRMPERFSPIPGHELQGQLTAPLTLSVLQGKEITLSGHLEAKDMAWSSNGLSASGITGRMPFSEKLKWDGKNLAFTHLITQNPFERVDFERVRPLLQGTDQLRIGRIRWEEKTYGPLIGFFSIRQNMAFAHQFDLDLGRGRAYGQMFLDAHPANLQVGLLSRLTGLDLNEFLPKKFLVRMPGGQKSLSGRTGLVISLNRHTVDGRVDITEIGGPQLIALMNILDPGYEDEKMNKIRSLLQVGYPTAVELSFAEGYLNMDVALAGLGLAHRQSLRGIPISSFLSSATAEVLKKAEEGPLK